MTELSDFYFEEEKELVDGLKCPSILCDFDANCPSVVDRYYTRYYYRKSDSTQENEDHLILIHSNRVCLVGLAPSHIAFAKGIQSVDFNIGNIDRRQNHCSGKSKKGAMNLQPSSAVAIVTCTDGTQYKIVACVTGKLIEVNERLMKNPGLLAKEGDGYVAICLPKIENADVIKQSLISEELYKSQGAAN
ncbi:Protein Abitram [Pseudolycoriella hygida]|uniref:Protein Abitram n=1 Tax=Pseudolycoriella hygida TaxID=35572 RepID=A0A9Q0RX73_9DIPT|nr:Protein Abitram [Pseudolycoriella hygida]